MQEHQNSDEHALEGKRQNGVRDFLRRSEINGIATAVWVFILGFFLLRLYVNDHITTEPYRTVALIDSMFNLAIVIVIVVHAVMYHKQAKAMNDQWLAMKDSLEQTKQQTLIAGESFRVNSQAYVCVRDIQIDQVRDRILIEVENLGRVPASDIAISFWLRLELPETFKRKNPIFQKVYEYGKKTELFSGNLPIRIPIPHIEWLDGVEIGFIKAEVGTLIAEGLITFYDGFLPRTPKHTHFAFDYDMGEKRWYPRRILSPEELAEAVKGQTAKQNTN